MDKYKYFQMLFGFLILKGKPINVYLIITQLFTSTETVPTTA